MDLRGHSDRGDSVLLAIILKWIDLGGMVELVNFYFCM
jgi:hypothetical protein